MNGYWITGIVAGVLGLAIGAGAAYTWENRALLAEQVAHARDTAADAEAQTKAVTAARAEEQRRTAAQQEVAENAAKERDAARADAASAASAADGLRHQVDVLVRAAHTAQHPSASTGSAPASDALDLLADVLGRADERAGDLAKIADAARIAGQQCERDYEALKAPSSP